MAKPTAQKAQEQDRQPGIEAKNAAASRAHPPRISRQRKVDGKHALITVGIVYLDEHGTPTRRRGSFASTGEGCACVAIQGDITGPECAPRAVAEFLERARAPRLDVLVNNAASVTAYRGSTKLIDYSATEGAITTLTRSLDDLARGTRHPSQRCGAGTDLDAADTGVVRRRRSAVVRQRHRR
jgi:hypothetical protein